MAKKEKYKTRSDGRKLARIRTGRYKDDGSPEIVCVYGRTDREIDAKIAELRTDKQRGTITSPGCPTLEEYAETWLTVYKARLRPNTVKNYRQVLSAYILPEIGRKRLKTLTRTDIQRILNHSSHATGKKILAVMVQIQEAALADHWISAPFCLALEVTPKQKTSAGSGRRALTPEELAAVKAADLDPMDRAYINILLGCGLRREEAIALRRMDIDTTTREVIVRRVLTYGGGTKIEDDAKTATSFRRVPIPAPLYQQILSYTITRKDDELLFVTHLGTVLSSGAYTAMWARIRAKLSAALGSDWEPTAYYFRHNYATMLWYSDVSLHKAKELMGHGNSATLEKVYLHLDEKKEKAADKLDRLFAQTM